VASVPVVRPGNQVLVADYQPGSGFGPRQVNDYEFVWILRGSARWTVQGPAGPGVPVRRHEELLWPGTLTLTPAGAIDSYRWDAEAVSTHAYVHFELISDPGPAVTAQWPRSRSLATHPLLRGIIEHLLQLAPHDDEPSRRRTDQLIGLLLDCFVHDPMVVPARSAAPPVLAVFHHARDTWRAEGLRILSAAELAAAANLSVSHLFRVFRSAYDCGPVRALELVRLARAAIALQRTNASLTEVARQCGFANAYHFSRRFARTYALPPGSYRALSTGPDPLEPIRAAGLLEVATPLMSSMED
jgi:AraC family transcriptional regulator